MASQSILLIEAFYTGSHKQLIDLLHREVRGTELVTLSGKKWHWKARTAALWLSQAIPIEHKFRTLFTSSVLNLAELVALRPDLAGVRKVLYFHENQLIYPVRKQQDRDFQFGYNQILSCMVADVVLFNSKHNMDTFLDSINSHLKLIPDHRPKGIAYLIRPKCYLLHFPIIFPMSKEIDELDAVEEIFIPIDESRIKDEEKHRIKTGTVEVSSKDAVKIDDISEQMVGICKSKCESGSFMLDKTENKDRNIENEWKVKTKCNAEEQYSESSMIFSKSVVENPMIVESFKDDSKQLSEKMKNKDDKKEDSREVARNKGVDGNSAGTTKKIEELMETGENAEVTRKKCKLNEESSPLHIVWPHRWEHDKDPELFFKVIIKLHEEDLDFRVSVLGETYVDVPDIFAQSKEILKEKMVHWGFLPSKQQYYRALKSADCVVSTAKHEFFGVAMLEAVHLGCYPLCPNKLVYPEIFPKECLYNTEQQLYKRLREFCRKPHFLRQITIPVDPSQYSWSRLKDQYLEFLL